MDFSPILGKSLNQVSSRKSNPEDWLNEGLNDLIMDTLIQIRAFTVYPPNSFFEIQLHGLFFLKYPSLEMLLKIFEYLKGLGLSFYLSRSDYQLTVRANRKKFFSMIWEDCSYSEHFELIPRIKAGSVKRFEAEYSRISVIGYDKKSHLESVSDSPYHELFKQKFTDDFEDLFRVEFRLHYADKNQRLTQKIKEGFNLLSLKSVFLELIGEQVRFSNQLKKLIAGGRYEK